MADPIRHVVADGECIASIAYRYGLWWQTVWLSSLNDGLRQNRSSPNVLRAGDVVMVPAKTPKVIAKPTGATHRFRRLGIPARLRLKIVTAGSPRASEPFTITIDGKTTTGTTGAEGEIDVALAPDAEEAVLTVGAGEDATSFRFRLRTLPPASDPAGVRRRLENLGYGGPVDAALRRFQADQSLTVTGEADTATQAALVTAHGV